MIGTRDRLALAGLVGAVPPVAVDRVLRQVGAVAERVRTLPPWVTTYHVLASAMCPLAGYDDITDLLWTTLPEASGRRLARDRPTRGAITRARSRLGAEPFAALLGHLVRAILADFPQNVFHLHRFETADAAELWWITDADTGALRGCDVHGTGLDAAVALVRSVGATRVTADLPVEVGAALQRRLTPGVEVTTVTRPAGDGVLWQAMRARNRTSWQQEALARAGVSVALERALMYAREATDQCY